ncbi:MAG: pyridoxal phosphate-dependent aminotransferase [Acidobacteria bacterium]|nr:pyridoxal phosphate-dependent aminotransferase [Acidobacteriota bacterium]
MANSTANMTKREIKLSDRVSRISVSSTMAVAAEAERLRAEGKDLVDFGAGEPDFPTPDNVKEAAIKAIRDNFSKYTAAPGTMELRKAIVDRHAADFGTAYTPAECIATAGGKQAIFNAISSLINPGDEVILPVPYWVTFADLINYAGGTPVMVETREESGFELTAEMVKKAITPRTKLAIINSPNNPSGAVVPLAEAERILEVCAANNVWLMTDECYCQFFYETKPYSLAGAKNAKDNIIVVGSLSKTYAMTGWRVGFALGPAPIIGAMGKLQSHSTSNPSSIAQKAAVEAVRGSQDSVPVMLAEYRRRRDFVVPKLRAIPGVVCNMPQGAFYAYPNIGKYLGAGKAAATVTELSSRLLREADVVVVPGEAFGTNAHFRLSYATSMEQLEKGLDRLAKFFAAQG